MLHVFSFYLTLEVVWYRFRTDMTNKKVDDDF